MNLARSTHHTTHGRCFCRPPLLPQCPLGYLLVTRSARQVHIERHAVQSAGQHTTPSSQNVLAAVGEIYASSVAFCGFLQTCRLGVHERGALPLRTSPSGPAAGAYRARTDIQTP